MDYKFYMQRVDRNGNLIDDDPVDIESEFMGLKYRLCEGLENVGAPKNIYVENYPEGDGPRVYHPADNNGSVSHKETTVKLDVIFSGEDTYRSTYNSFREFVANTRIYFWDTARHKKVLLVLNSETAPVTDTIKGVRYIEVVFSFTNIWGRGKKCNDAGTLL